MEFVNGESPTTQVGYINKNNQKCLGHRNVQGGVIVIHPEPSLTEFNPETFIKQPLIGGYRGINVVDIDIQIFGVPVVDNCQ